MLGPRAQTGISSADLHAVASGAPTTPRSWRSADDERRHFLENPPPLQPDRNILMEALIGRDVESVRNALHEEPLSVHVPIWIRRCALSPLLLAVREGCSRDILVALLEHGAQVNDRDGEGCTALMRAVLSADLRHGPAGPPLPPPSHASSPPGRGAFGLGQGHDEKGLIRLAACLLAWGADARIGDERGRTPAAVARERGLGRLGDVIELYCEMSAARMLCAAWGRPGMEAAAQRRSRACLLDVGPAVGSLVCGYLAPAWACARTHVRTAPLL